MQTKIPLTITEDTFDQIRYLCTQISEVEWSGALFYTIEGSIKDPENFKIQLKYILPLDKGSQTYTEYDLDSRFIDFIEEDFEERCTWKVGHIHSHNHMPVFFSGTDSKELQDNAAAHNFYLSLIVNNKMETTAKVAILGKVETSLLAEPILATDENGIPYPIAVQDFNVNYKKLFLFDCEITQPTVNISVEDTFKRQTQEIISRAENKKGLIKEFTSSFTGKNVATSYPYSEFAKEVDFTNPFHQFSNMKELLESDLEEIDVQEVEEFVAFWVGSAFEIKDFGQSLEEILYLAGEKRKNPQVTYNLLNRQFDICFNSYFPNVNIGTNDFAEILSVINVILSEFTDNSLIKQIRNVIKKEEKTNANKLSTKI